MQNACLLKAKKTVKVMAIAAAKPAGVRGARQSESPRAGSTTAKPSHEGGCWLHNPHYDFNDEVIPLGAGFLAALVEDALPVGN